MKSTFFCFLLWRLSILKRTFVCLIQLWFESQQKVKETCDETENQWVWQRNFWFLIKRFWKTSWKQSFIDFEIHWSDFRRTSDRSLFLESPLHLSERPALLFLVISIAKEEMNTKLKLSFVLIVSLRFFRGRRSRTTSTSSKWIERSRRQWFSRRTFHQSIVESNSWRKYSFSHCVARRRKSSSSSKNEHFTVFRSFSSV